MTDHTPELIQFFKALADGDRLQIAGLLARQKMTPMQLATTLGLKPMAVMNHLTRLVEADLVAEINGTYHLRLDHMHALAARLAPHLTPPVPADGPEFDRKVLKDFMQDDGSFKELPAQEKKCRVVVQYICAQFEAGREYPEKQVNELIKRFYADAATLRRAMIDYGMMQRANGIYWKV